VALKSDVTAEKTKNQLLRDFWSCSIFDFCNNIGTNRTNRAGLSMSVVPGGPEVAGNGQNVVFDPTADFRPLVG
jgi:hypothetical protein